MQLSPIIFQICLFPLVLCKLNLVPEIITDLHFIHQHIIYENLSVSFRFVLEMRLKTNSNPPTTQKKKKKQSNNESVN